MAREKYVVVNHRGQWEIAHHGKHDGPYPTQRDAVRNAVDMAHQAGQDAQVLVQDSDDRFRTEWTYGRDPYPPQG